MEIPCSPNPRIRSIPCARLLCALVTAFCLMMSGLLTAGAAQVDGHAAERVTESLDRGLVAMPRENDGVYLGWRLLKSDPADVAFNVYRAKDDGEYRRLNDSPIRKTTDYVDNTAEPDASYRYTVRPVVNSAERAASDPASVGDSKNPNECLAIPLKGDYTFQKVGIGDLNGDGKYDFVIKQPNSNVDPWYKYWRPSEGTYKVEAYLHDGTFLWRKNLGWSIERGIWYSPMIVYDLDGDGRAEVALKTGEGDPRIKSNDVNEDKLPLPVQGESPVYKDKVITGPEYLSVLEGMTGEEVCRTGWPSREGFSNYNKSSRNQACVAYLDGKTPCLIVERGTYGLMKVEAYELHDGSLRQLWRWDNRSEPDKYRAQGAHSMHAVDVDDDGRDEVFLGSSVLDDNGEALWSTGLGHPDHHYVGDIMPDRPGLEVYYGIEPGRKRNTMCVADARTGEILWGLDERTYHVHSSGLCSDILAEHEGLECYGIDRDHPDGEKPRLFTGRGKLISTRDMGFAPRALWWDAAPQRELFLGHRMKDYDGAAQPTRLDGKPVAFADIAGDWREELIVSLPGELRVYSTTIPAEDRRTCLMQDVLYRLDVAIQAMGYTQVPMLSYYLAGE